MIVRSFAFLAAFLAASTGALADAGHGHGSRIGSVGAPEDVSRTIEIVMTDNAYDHDEIDLDAGETVRFVLHNRGQLVHEFNIGTPKMHASHQVEMMEMMQSGEMSPTGFAHGHGGMMGHDDPNSLLLNPGETKELVWRFDQAVGRLQFACNVPGHYQAGMVGDFDFDT